MLRWIFIAQAAIYLLLMPIMHSRVEIGYEPPLLASALAIGALLLGSALIKFRSVIPAAVRTEATLLKIQPHAYLSYAIPVFALLYAVIVVAFGLFSRRQGSEFMADLYAGLPLYALGTLRTYEILFVPITLLYLFGQSPGRLNRAIVLVALLVSLPFTGIIDSRSRLLLISLYIICFIPPKAFLSFVFRYVRVWIAGTIIIGTFLFYSSERLAAYNSVGDYLAFEVYQRLDGLNLVTDMRDAGLVDRVGSFDGNMFAPLVSKIPFLDAAREAKLIGRTSTKQYYLQELLGRNQLDTPNSMIADPLYFAGWSGIIIAFTLIGYMLARIDHYVARDAFMRGRLKTTAAIAFVTSFVLIENDLIAAPITFVQNFAFIGVLLFFGTRVVRNDRSLTFLPQGAETRRVAVV